jgi:hypothetical protein
LLLKRLKSRWKDWTPEPEAGSCTP